MHPQTPRTWRRLAAGGLAALLLAACGGGASGKTSSSSSSSSASSSAASRISVSDADLQRVAEQYFKAAAANDYEKVLEVAGSQLAAAVAHNGYILAIPDAVKAKFGYQATTVTLDGSLTKGDEDGTRIKAKGSLKRSYADESGASTTVHDLVFDTADGQLRLVDYSVDDRDITAAEAALAPGASAVPVGDSSLTLVSGLRFWTDPNNPNEVQYVVMVQNGSTPIVFIEGNDPKPVHFVPTGGKELSQVGRWIWDETKGAHTTTYFFLDIQSDGGVPDFGGKLTIDVQVGGKKQSVELDVPPFTDVDGKPVKAHDVLDAQLSDRSSSGSSSSSSSSSSASGKAISDGEPVARSILAKASASHSDDTFGVGSAVRDAGLSGVAAATDADGTNVSLYAEAVVSKAKGVDVETFAIYDAAGRCWVGAVTSKGGSYTSLLGSIVAPTGCSAAKDAFDAFEGDRMQPVG